MISGAGGALTRPKNYDRQKSARCWLTGFFYCSTGANSSSSSASCVNCYYSNCLTDSGATNLKNLAANRKNTFTSLAHFF